MMKMNILFHYYIQLLSDRVSLCYRYLFSGKKCFVHCVRGFSRSATFVIAYVMFNNKLSFDKAYDFVFKKRSLINPNDGFIEQLKEFEEILIICKYREDLIRNLYIKNFKKIDL